MRSLIGIVVVLLVAACGGSISDEESDKRFWTEQAVGHGEDAPTTPTGTLVSESVPATPIPVEAMVIDQPADEVEAAPSDTTDDLGMVRQLAFDYWDAFSTWDKDKTLSYLAGSYRDEMGGTIRQEIGKIKWFRVRLHVDEGNQPLVTAPGEAEIVLLIGKLYGELEEPEDTRPV